MHRRATKNTNHISEQSGGDTGPAKGSVVPAHNYMPVLEIWPRAMLQGDRMSCCPPFSPLLGSTPPLPRSRTSPWPT